MPFFPSPLRDDGYDVSDYCNVHPNYGSLDDLRRIVETAHRRDIRIIIELVLNHTSDQHPWFQRSRRAKSGSPERDYYIWREHDRGFRDARIIFSDTERSNWAWDVEAQAFYFHRFFSHQPDLNFDNPQVFAEILGVLKHWLDIGVDGFRLDAVPYLVKREGTNCENLPETHRIVRDIRAFVDANYQDRVLLAEANQWPAEVRAYFGDGDECHMAYHFPLMPRIFMGLRLEDTQPVREIMNATPEIPSTCQWALFLRNHDELTLEMVSSEEREYMYLAYGTEPRAHLNLGIRRRLAPLVQNSRPRIELLKSLLMSFPGTPVIYYGDEIGMGDDTGLHDRDGVRTPMQWTGGPNAGFSAASPEALCSRPLADAVYGYAAVNVEAQLSNPSSLLNWMKRLLALRKLFKVFGRGTMELLPLANRKVLAYVRRFERDTILCIANFSRFAQPAELDLSAFEGCTPIELFGYSEFPRIGRLPYFVTLGGYGIYWFELRR